MYDEILTILLYLEIVELRMMILVIHNYSIYQNLDGGDARLFISLNNYNLRSEVKQLQMPWSSISYPGIIDNDSNWDHFVEGVTYLCHDQSINYNTWFFRELFIGISKEIKMQL